MSDSPSPLDDRIRAAFAALGDDDLVDPPPPPPAVWEGVAAGVAGEAAQTPERRQDDAADPVPPQPPRPLATTAGRAAHPRRAVALLAAVAAVLVVLVGGLVVVRSRQSTVAELAVLSDAGLPTRSNVSGRAELVEAGDGQKVLDVDVPDLPAPADGQVFEVWLLAGDGGGLQSLGLMEHSGRFVVPPGVDTAKYNIVDVSREPVNGDPTHSGDSIVRGTLVPSR